MSNDLEEVGARYNTIKIIEKEIKIDIVEPKEISEPKDHTNNIKKELIFGCPCACCQARQRMEDKSRWEEDWNKRNQRSSDDF